jgi:DnaJ family protein C protein 7
LERFEEAVQQLEAVLKLDADSKDVKQRLSQAKLELKKSKRKNYYKILDIPKVLARTYMCVCV